ncbi:hypothetical protein A2773_05790 [Candidatus Gottesmanbacteria bacterium RIFCSPHIGHO2_01_FULL_39_10]|uniref:Uncharacterized protein n=1 Tax=Candidatus Gottesmanbacteria bacterium RIFCSPHIGHO2_01_FULL_39_10 TaxID=1798375 RepID=A0A1F5ZKS8_9BACT|nr:MAG: hypothetical protein A2773_05790 [Candidatus Gottesmanbacteria bacterium RIFCSPHIGHO2_01_FULL_39_10]
MGIKEAPQDHTDEDSNRVEKPLYAFYGPCNGSMGVRTKETGQPNPPGHTYVVHAGDDPLRGGEVPQSFGTVEEVLDRFPNAKLTGSAVLCTPCYDAIRQYQEQRAASSN